MTKVIPIALAPSVRGKASTPHDALGANMAEVNELYLLDLPLGDDLVKKRVLVQLVERGDQAMRFITCDSTASPSASFRAPCPTMTTPALPCLSEWSIAASSTSASRPVPMWLYS